MRWKMTLTSVCMLILFGSLLLAVSDNGRSKFTEEEFVLMIISGYEGYDENILEITHEYYDHLLINNYSETDILFLTLNGEKGYDGDANISNINDGFEWLESCSDQDSNVIIYIYDHEQMINGNVTFQFEDGSMTSNDISSALENIVCNEMELILTGNRSSLAGPELEMNGREILCSMGSDQTFEDDHFDIERGLTDPSADTDHDGIITYNEAFWKEYDNLIQTGQIPEIFGE